MGRKGMELVEKFTACLESLASEGKSVPSFEDVCRELKVGVSMMDKALVSNLGWGGREVVAKYQKQCD